MENKQLVHYGKLLKLRMEETGATNIHVMKLLDIKAYETLYARLEDGKFSFDELRLLTDKGLL